MVADPRPSLAALAELVDDPADLDDLLAIRALIDPIARDAAGALRLVPLADRYAGRHAAVVMGPFLTPGPSRFSPGTFGVLYAADSLDVAVRESAYHAGRYLAASAAPPGRVARFAISLEFAGSDVADMRIKSGGDPAIYDPLNYGAAQRAGVQVRARGTDAIWYDSIRAPHGTCYGIFRPVAVASVADLSEELALVWDGSRVEHYELIRSMPL